MFLEHLMIRNSKMNSWQLLLWVFEVQTSIKDYCQAKTHGFFTKKTLVIDLDCHFSLTTIIRQVVPKNYCSISKAVFYYLMSTALETGEELKREFEKE